MQTKSFASRKFLLCGTALLFGLAGYVYALVYVPDQFATVCTFIVSVLGVYAGGNVASSYLYNRTNNQTPQDTHNDRPGD